MKKIRSNEEWAGLVNEQRLSGKSVAAFCREKAIHPNLFYRKKQLSGSTGTFVKVPTITGDRRAVEIKSGDLVIRLEMPFADAELVRVLRCIREAENAVIS